MPPLEAWEKVLVDFDAYSETQHALLTCIECHRGVDDSDKETAHEGLRHDPSLEVDVACARCHPDESAQQEGNLHFNLRGYETSLATRSSEEAHAALGEMQTFHCDNCHASCGQCHVSQPHSVGGGLLEGHVYKKTPPMTRTCTACHGSRVGNEYLGKNEGYLADVHFRQARFVCADCHEDNEMHGAYNQEDAHRYDGEERPACETCHQDVIAGTSGVVQHTIHTDRLSCQVCHSVTYKSCDGCHTHKNADGVPFFETEGSSMTFFIGKNPIQNEERPYEYVPVRHVPISRDSFEYYGENLLSNFDAAPTWRYTTPHNIQLETPQNRACTACHGNAEIFLTADKVAPDELEANRDVIIDVVPPVIGE